VRLGYVADDKGSTSLRLSPSHPRLHQAGEAEEKGHRYANQNKTPLRHLKNPLNEEVKTNKEAYKKNIGRSH